MSSFGSNGESVFRLPSTDQWPDGTSEPGPGSCSAVCVSPPSHILVHPPALVGVRTQHTHLVNYRSVLLFVCLRLSTTVVPITRWPSGDSIYYCSIYNGPTMFGRRPELPCHALHHVTSRLWTDTDAPPRATMTVDSGSASSQFIMRAGTSFHCSVEVDSIINPVSVNLLLTPSLKVHPVFHISLLKPGETSSLATPPTSPPPPRVIDGNPMYMGKKILDWRCRGKGIQYLVDWEGYGPEARKWIPRSWFFDSSLLCDFHSSHPSKPGGPPRGVRGRRVRGGGVVL